jgi:hypothetical protein
MFAIPIPHQRQDIGVEHDTRYDTKNHSLITRPIHLHIYIYALVTSLLGIWARFDLAVILLPHQDPNFYAYASTIYPHTHTHPLSLDL